ncbi:MAG: type VI secretion system ATPase TssH, partial [Deferribacterales bacterium]|nr:type VI secretion system ATPase TssH [Deferribacterales bacterium]
MINYNKMTIKAQEAIEETVKLADRLSNQVIQSEHLLAALLTQQEGLIRPLIRKIGADPDNMLSEVNNILNSLPKVSGASNQPVLSQDANKALDF